MNMNAIEAKKKTEEFLNGKLKMEQYDWVQKGIVAAVNKGQFSYWIDGTIYESVEKMLIDEGFGVKKLTREDYHTTTTICWD